MYVPMENLSAMTTRTDSGSGVRQRPGSGVEEKSSKFERMFEKELSKHGSQEIEKNPNTNDNGKEAQTVSGKDEDNTEETLAAGVMGNLMNNVVFILEGDSNSENTGELQMVNNAEQPDVNQIVNPDNNETKPEINEKITTEFAQALNAVKSEATMTKPETNTEVSVENTSNTGEVMARMPDMRTQDGRNNEESSKSFENGNPSPLENKNEETKAGQKDKSYSEAVNAIKNAAEDKIETAVTTANEVILPLSEGIKPDQFQAIQQMTQAALNNPVKTENLFEEMISRVEMMQNDTKSAMTIQLNPEFLGKVALEVSVDAAGLHVKINAEDSGVRSMINGQLATLIDSLENKGIAVVDVEVIYTGINYGSFSDPREGEQQNGSNHRQPAKREINSTDGVAYYTALPDLMEFYREAGVSSVEYSA